MCLFIPWWRVPRRWVYGRGLIFVSERTSKRQFNSNVVPLPCRISPVRWSVLLNFQPKTFKPFPILKHLNHFTTDNQLKLKLNNTGEISNHTNGIYTKKKRCAETEQARRMHERRALGFPHVIPKSKVILTVNNCDQDPPGYSHSVFHRRDRHITNWPMTQ